MPLVWPAALGSGNISSRRCRHAGAREVNCRISSACLAISLQYLCVQCSFRCILLYEHCDWHVQLTPLRSPWDDRSDLIKADGPGVSCPALSHCESLLHLGMYL